VTTQATHNDILRRIDEEARDREAFRRQSAETTDALLRTLQTLGQAVEGIEVRLGEEPDSDGAGGRGILGDLAQIKRKVLAFDLLRARVLGGVSVAVTLGGAFIAALWWALGERIAHFFKGTAP
jgi:hypothetical protein